MELRKVEVLKKGQWKEIQFEELREGDQFRLFNPPDWRPVKSADGQDSWVATSDPFKEPGGVWTIMIETEEEVK